MFQKASCSPLEMPRKATSSSRSTARSATLSSPLLDVSGLRFRFRVYGFEGRFVWGSCFYDPSWISGLDVVP